MILTREQYEATEKWILRFKESLDLVRARSSSGENPADRIYESAFLHQIKELEAQLTEYDALTSGTPFTMRINSLDELPRVLIKARIAAGMTQQELAERLGVAAERAMQEEEYEYESASLGELLRIAEALGLVLETAIVVESNRAA